jgi:N-carbamoyl-L-amino-acid hydrolase
LEFDMGLAVRADSENPVYYVQYAHARLCSLLSVLKEETGAVPGGRFDGILGIAVALESVALLNDAGISTRHPVLVVNWTGEEGARFPPAMLGSGVIVGAWDGEYARSRTDADGVCLGEELARIGYLGSAQNRLTEFHVALEAHIEQGTQLEELDAQLGIVTAVSPVRWLTVRVSGTGGHAGGPGPQGRRDAMVAAAGMIVAARDHSLSAGGTFKTTVGTLSAVPGSRNVIPHEVSFSLDIRSQDNEQLDRALAEVTGRFEQIAAAEGVDLAVEPYWSMRTAPFDTELRELLGQIATQQQVRWAPLRGSIGHDTVHLATAGRAAMLFTRTTNGRSHCEDEHAPWESILATAGVLATAVAALAQ